MTAAARPAEGGSQTGHVYVFGFVDPADYPLGFGDVPGVDPNELSLVARGEVAAVCAADAAALVPSDHPNAVDPTQLESVARHHDAVVQGLADVGPVLPARLATVCRDEEQLADLLAVAKPDIARLLGELRGRTEWQLRLERTQPEAPPDLAGSPPAVDAGALSGADYLRTRAQGSARRRDAVHAATDLDEQLSSLADRVAGPAGWPPGPGLWRAYLVRDEQSERVAASFGAARTRLVRLGWTARLSGPLPAYSFSSLRLEV